MAGQGTLGMELARQAPDLDAVFVCVGGGGLIGGVGAAIKTLSPQTRIVGVWPEASTCMRDSIAAGEIVATPERETLSEASTGAVERSEEHTSELQSLMRISYAVFCLKKKKINYN